MSGNVNSPISDDNMLAYIYDDVDDGDIFASENVNDNSEDCKVEKHYHQTQIAEVLKENESLKELVKQLQSDKITLEQRISEVYKTAKAELERKDRRLQELNKEKDDILFKRNSFRNVPFRKEAAIIGHTPEMDKSNPTYKIPKKKQTESFEGRENTEKTRLNTLEEKIPQPDHIPESTNKPICKQEKDKVEEIEHKSSQSRGRSKSALRQNDQENNQGFRSKDTKYSQRSPNTSRPRNKSEIRPLRRPRTPPGSPPKENNRTSRGRSKSRHNTERGGPRTPSRSPPKERRCSRPRSQEFRSKRSERDTRYRNSARGRPNQANCLQVEHKEAENPTKDNNCDSITLMLASEDENCFKGATSELHRKYHDRNEEDRRTHGRHVDKSRYKGGRSRSRSPRRDYRGKRGYRSPSRRRFERTRRLGSRNRSISSDRDRHVKETHPQHKDLNSRSVRDTNKTTGQAEPPKISPSNCSDLDDPWLYLSGSGDDVKSLDGQNGHLENANVSELEALRRDLHEKLEASEQADVSTKDEAQQPARSVFEIRQRMCKKQPLRAAMEDKAKLSDGQGHNNNIKLYDDLIKEVKQVNSAAHDFGHVTSNENPQLRPKTEEIALKEAAKSLTENGDEQPKTESRKRIGLDAYMRRKQVESNVPEEIPKASDNVCVEVNEEKEKGELQPKKECSVILIEDSNEEKLPGQSEVLALQGGNDFSKDGGSFVHDFSLSEDEQEEFQVAKVETSNPPAAEKKINILNITVLRPKREVAPFLPASKEQSGSQIRENRGMNFENKEPSECIEKIQEEIQNSKVPSAHSRTHDGPEQQKLDEKELQKCLEEDTPEPKSKKGIVEPNKTPTKTHTNRQHIIDLFGTPGTPSSPEEPLEVPKPKAPDLANVKRNLQMAGRKSADDSLLNSVLRKKEKAPNVEPSSKSFGNFNHPTFIPEFVLKDNGANNNKKKTKRTDYKSKVAELVESEKRKIGKSPQIKIKMDFARHKRKPPLGPEEGPESKKKKTDRYEKFYAIYSDDDTSDNSSGVQTKNPEPSPRKKKTTPKNPKPNRKAKSTENQAKTKKKTKAKNAQLEDDSGPAKEDIMPGRGSRVRKLPQNEDEPPKVATEPPSPEIKTRKRIKPTKIGEVSESTTDDSKRKFSCSSDDGRPEKLLKNDPQKAKQSPLPHMEEMLKSLERKTSCVTTYAPNPEVQQSESDMNASSVIHEIHLDTKDVDMLGSFARFAYDNMTTDFFDKSLLSLGREEKAQGTNIEECDFSALNTSTPIKKAAPAQELSASSKQTVRTQQEIGMPTNTSQNCSRNYLTAPLKRDRRRRIGIQMIDIT